MFEELRTGLMEMFREIRLGTGDMKEKRKNADCLSNISGKVTNTYRVEAAWNEQLKSFDKSVQ